MTDQEYAALRDRLLRDPAVEAYVKDIILTKPLVFHSADRSTRLEIADTAVVNNATFNLSSGHVVVEDWVFFGHGVKVLTGTHDVSQLDERRQVEIPSSGRDILIQQGAWISSGATLIGPCTIGRHAVVAAGAVVVGDVAPFTVVGGVPAKVMRTLEIPR